MRSLLFASVVALVVAQVAHVRPADAEPRVQHASTKASTPPDWCAPEVEALPGDVCHIDGGQRDGKRTLVIFLHGAIAKNTTWQWTQERALLRQAKQSGFEAIFPRAPLGSGGYLWPGSSAASSTSGGGARTVEQELVDGWAAARKLLEERQGRPFDEVFVMGFSSGAYFVSALAQREHLDVDGYAVFAGGVPVQNAGDVARRAPVFVGVCGADRATAPHSRALGGTLAVRGWPHRVDEQPIGHMFGDVHVAHAVAYLRASAAKARATPRQKP